MKKIERDVLLYTTSQKKKIFIFLIFSFIKKDFQFFEKVFFNLFFKESQKYERLLFLLIFLETISKFSILRELVILFKLVFTKRPFFKNSYLYNFMLKNYQNRRNGMDSKIFNEKNNFYNFFFLKYNQKIKNIFTRAKIYSNCRFLFLYFKIFNKLSSFFFKKVSKFLVKNALCNSKLNFYLLKLNSFKFNIIPNLEKKYLGLKFNKNLTKRKINQKKPKVWSLNFYYWLFIEVQYLFEFNVKFTKNNRLWRENYPLILSTINFFRKNNNKFFLQENLENFLDKFSKCIVYPDILFYKSYKNNLENTERIHSRIFQLKIFLENMKKNYLKSYTMFYCINLIKSNKMRLICKYFMYYLC
jgi:hypothetical protein